ncbi:MAG: pectate lyase [Candidatus Hydrogenedens sp.]|nr:pectate lyase [Candidatus Hydrogenedens sp.]
MRAIGLTTLTLFTALAALAEAPPLAQFRDGAKHYRDGTQDETYERWPAENIAAIADNMLLYQHANGGWKSNWDPQRRLSPEEAARIPGELKEMDTTFDNRATYPQIEYLAAAYTATGDVRYRDAVLRGLEFMLMAQHPCGGFPHSYPSQANYRPLITFMDDVTPGALTTLRKAAAGEGDFAFLDAALRERLAEASARGLDCVLRLQQPWQGEPGVWAGQYDPTTLQPAGARSFELPSFVSAESLTAVRYLMAIPDPSPEVIRAIEGAARWYRAAAIPGKRIEVFPIDPVRFDNHTATKDVRIIDDPAAGPIWARFYELDSLRPFMANRDGNKVYDLQEVALERRTGYSWYNTAPANFLEYEYPAWEQGRE